MALYVEWLWWCDLLNNYTITVLLPVSKAAGLSCASTIRCLYVQSVLHWWLCSMMSMVLATMERWPEQVSSHTMDGGSWQHLCIYSYTLYSMCFWLFVFIHFTQPFVAAQDPVAVYWIQTSLGRVSTSTPLCSVRLKRPMSLSAGQFSLSLCASKTSKPCYTFCNCVKHCKWWRVSKLHIVICTFK